MYVITITIFEEEPGGTIRLNWQTQGHSTPREDQAAAPINQFLTCRNLELNLQEMRRRISADLQVHEHDEPEKKIATT
jgi:hypothetical protein